MKKLTLKFNLNGQKLLLKGEPELIKRTTSLTSMWKAIQQQGEGFVIDCRMVQQTGEGEQANPKELTPV